MYQLQSLKSHTNSVTKFILTSTQVKMTPTRQILKNYLFCSFLFGVYSKNPYCAQRKTSIKVLSYIPNAIHLMFVIVFIFLLFNTLITSSRVLFFYFYLTSLCIPNILSICQRKTSESEIESILLRLERTEKYLKTFIDMPLSFEIILQSIRFKLLIYIFSVIVAYVYKFFIQPEVFNWLSSSVVFVLMVYKCWMLFFVIFLIDYKTFLMSALNNHLDKLQYSINSIKLDSSIWELLHLFKHIQTVHFELHKVTQLISSRFGWILLINLMDLFIIFTNNIIAIILAIIDPSIPILLARNFL